ncbi:MAG: cyclic nucleotide-binding domain-containing protein [Chloroflexota bacterium]
MTAGAPARSPVRAAAASAREVLRHRDLRAILLAWTLGVAADWMLTVVGLLVAWDIGGAVAVGLFGLVRMAPATVVNLLVDAGAFARPERALVGVGVVRALAAGVVALAVAADAPLVALGAIAVVAAAGALVRPTSLAILPAIATDPADLVGANVGFTLGEALGAAIGPLTAGALVAAWGPVPAALLGALLLLATGAVLLRVRVADAARPARHEREHRWRFAAGLRTLAARPPGSVLIGSFVVQTLVRGALTTFLVILALDVLDMGEAGVGVLGAAIGLGGVAGAIAALAMGTRRSLAPVFALALAAWGAPIAVIGFLPAAGVAVAALAAVGTANAILDVAGFTLVQRSTPGRSLSAVFSVMEVGAGVAVSLGGILAPALVAVLGVERALVITGLVLPTLAVLGWPIVRRLDAEGVVPERQAALLRGIPLFCALPLSGLERVAAGMVPVRYPAGARLMTEGEPGDRYLVLAAGSVAVRGGGRDLGRNGPGDGLGEIALLREVPRTATVTALEPVEAFEIDRATFLAAVTGHEPSAAAAERVVEARLGGSG